MKRDSWRGGTVIQHSFVKQYSIITDIMQQLRLSTNCKNELNRIGLSKWTVSLPVICSTSSLVNYVKTYIILFVGSLLVCWMFLWIFWGHCRDLCYLSSSISGFNDVKIGGGQLLECICASKTCQYKCWPTHWLIANLRLFQPKLNNSPSMSWNAAIDWSVWTPSVLSFPSADFYSFAQLL